MKCLCLHLPKLCGPGQSLEQQIWSGTFLCLFTCLIERLGESWQCSFKCCHFCSHWFVNVCAYTCLGLHAPVLCFGTRGAWVLMSCCLISNEKRCSPCSSNYCEQLITQIKITIKFVCLISWTYVDTNQMVFWMDAVSVFLKIFFFFHPYSKK